MRKRKNDSDQSEDDDEQNDDNQQQQKIQIRKPRIDRIDNFKTNKNIIINVSMTQYPVVSEVAESLGWRIQTDHRRGDWDVFWTDFTIDPDVLIKMHLFQKINYFPGICHIARKNLLGHNLRKMQKWFPDQYNFFPMTWMLPQQYAEFRQYYESKQKGKARTYIVKPQAQCQGRGIYLTRNIEDMENGKHYVVQRYMARPYLLQGLKFDMRIYVLMCGTDPLKLYMYNQGLARLATQPYQQPNTSNLSNLCMHLTNYAINKLNPKFIFNNSVHNMGVGHKRALSCVMKQLARQGMDVQALKQKIKAVIIKTIISGLPLIAHQYKFSQPQDYTGNVCFHILGMDVMLNSKGDPYVIQVNHTPSFTTDTPLDHKIKFNLIKDALVLMNINTKQKKQLLKKCKEINSERLLTGKRQIFDGVDRQAKIKQAQEKRQAYQIKHLGGFQKIYPFEDPQKNQKYQKMIETNMRSFLQQNQAIKLRYQKKQGEKLMNNQIKTLKARVKQNQFRKNNNTELLKNSELKVMQKVQKNIKNLATLKAQADQLQDEAAPEQNLSLSQPGPTTSQHVSLAERQYIKRVLIGANTPSNEQKIVNRVNQIKNIKRFNGIINLQNQSNLKNAKIQNSRLLGKSNLKTIHRDNPSQEFIKTENKLMHKRSDGQFLSIEQESIKKQVEKILKNRAVIKSETKQKPEKIIDSIEKQIKKKMNKKLTSNYNGAFCMPKISSIALGTQLGEKERDFYNFLAVGQRINHNSITNQSNA